MTEIWYLVLYCLWDRVLTATDDLERRKFIPATVQKNEYKRPLTISYRRNTPQRLLYYATHRHTGVCLLRFKKLNLIHMDMSFRWRNSHITASKARRVHVCLIDTLTKSGESPRPLNCLTLFWVGFVFCSPVLLGCQWVRGKIQSELPHTLEHSSRREGTYV